MHLLLIYLLVFLSLAPSLASILPKVDRVVAQHIVYENEERVNGIRHHVGEPLVERRIARDLVPRKLAAILEP